MGNYCIVRGCGRNYRKHKQLNYYTLPKERNRLIEWLKAAGRKDILDSSEGDVRQLASYRVCSRHFPMSSFKNKHLLPDAVPTLHLSGTDDHEAIDMELHEDIVCDKCTNTIVGYRYKCATCPNYDLCSTCEGSQVHSEHIMMRIPRPMKNVHIDRLVKQWRNFLNKEETSMLDLKQDSGQSEYSSDDEPITKYASKNYDSGIDLSEDVKNTIRNEVSRVLNLKKKSSGKNKRINKTETTRISEPPSKRFKVETEFNLGGNRKYQSIVDESDIPEVAFADVNEVGDQMMESVPSTSAVTTQETGPMQISNEDEKPPMCSGAMPMMHVKLSDDLSELMIEVTSDHQKTVYKYV